MALRPDRDYNAIDDISQFWVTNQLNVAKGGVASLKTAGSGVSLDNKASVVEYAANPSGKKPMGVLVQDVTYYSGSRVFKNFANGEIQPGDKCCLIRKGWVVTDQVQGTPTAGGTAYLGASGKVNAVQWPDAPVVGRFENTLDESNFVKLYVDL